MLRRRPTLFARTPFWVLIVAWACANTPQIAALHALVWVKNAQHFSHQAQLRNDVAGLLSGLPATAAATSVFATAETIPASSSELAPSADPSLKKLLLSATREDAGAGLPRSEPVRWPDAHAGLIAAHVADVPCPPPRA